MNLRTATAAAISLCLFLSAMLAGASRVPAQCTNTWVPGDGPGVLGVPVGLGVSAQTVREGNHDLGP
jgi:hypothetical protein